MLPRTAFEKGEKNTLPEPEEHAIATVFQPLLEAKKSPPAPDVKVPAILEKIAKCESRGQHYDANGEVVIGKNPNDIGKYQINQIVWGETAEKLQYDIFTEDGNEQMALQLYRAEGTAPWSASKWCWNKESGK